MEASDEYRKNSDVVKLFADDALQPTEDKGMRPAAVYELYLKWCKSHGAKAENNINLGKQLKRLGFNKARSNGKDYWCVNVTLAGKEIS
jgi:phage/plasmid-associated DNA primase